MKKEVKLSRIHCAGCAVSLEELLNEVNGVDNASIDLESKTLKISYNCDDEEQLMLKVKACIKKFDGTIKVIENDDVENQLKKEKTKRIFDICRIIVAISLVIIASILPQSFKWLAISIFVVAYLFVAYDVIYVAIKNLFNGKMLDENFLMFIATIGAFVLQEFIEAIAVMLFYNIGNFFENLAVEKSKKRVKSLMSLKVENVTLILDSGEIIVPVENIKKGSLIRIKPGERVPLDCKIVEGRSFFNTSAITGESRELEANVGDEILSGYINGDGMIVCSVTKTDKDSTVTKIINLVDKATKSKAPTEKFITKFAKWYTPVVVIVAVLLATVPLVFGGNFNDWIYRALVFLVVSCPCALVVSIPLGYFAGIGSCARNGILIKGANYIDLLAKIDTVIFDKTGTLTYGNFVIDEIFATEQSSREEVLELIAYAESFSNHRIAKSIVKHYNKKINTAWVEDYCELAGLGIKARLFYEECLVGNAELLKQNNIKFTEANKPGTVVYLAKSGDFLGYIIIVDQIRPESYLISKQLKALGIRNISMFTGDNVAVAEDVKKKLNFDRCYAGLMPSGKVEALKKFNGRKIAFVGDGINDAPVLVSADIGVSMGGVGNDIAIESANVVLMTDETSKLTKAIKISRKTKNIITQNIVFILLTKLAVLILSAVGLSGMWLAIFADVGVCLLSVLNSLRAMIIKDKANNKSSKKIKQLNEKEI